MHLIYSPAFERCFNVLHPASPYNLTSVFQLAYDVAYEHFPHDLAILAHDLAE